MTTKYKAYSNYKESGVEWLGSVPEHWELKKVAWGFQAEKGRNGQILTKEYCGANRGEFPVYSGQTDNDGVMGRINTFEFDSGSNGVLFSTTVGAKAMHILHLIGKFSLSQNCMIIVQKNKSFYTRYCYYHFQPLFQYERGLIPDHMQASFRMEDLYQYRIALPAYDEQQKIAGFLDYETGKIDGLIAKQKHLMALLHEKRQAVISHAVTKGLNPNTPMRPSGVEWLGDIPAHWEAIFIKHLSSVKRGASPRPIDDPKYFDDDGEYAWVRIADVSKAGMYLTSTTQRLSNLGASLSVKLQENQLFISIAGTVGKPCLTISKACIHDGFVYFPDLTINNKFLYYIFEAGEAFLGLGKMGTQLNLNTETVGCIKIGLPPVKEIEMIIKYIEESNHKFDNLISKAQSAITLMQERRTALISAAVTGKIDVRDWVAPEHSQTIQKDVA